jgi:UDP-glucose 4-epimerase
MKNILITGATGFIGERLAYNLKAKIKVIARKKHPFFDTIICDLEKDKIPQNALMEIDTVFHLAGVAHDFRDANKISSKYRAINVDASLALAKIAAENGVKNFVFLSSVKAGGSVNSKECLSENNQYEPKDIYGKSKREAEILLLEISQKSKMNVKIIRSSLVYGPRVKGNLRRMYNGIQHGWFPPLPETGNIRSMIHVDDLVRAILFVVEDNRANGEVYIATDGMRYSSCQIYEILSFLLNKNLPRWRVPKIIFNFAALLNSKIEYKVQKLLGSEYYTSQKLCLLGFKTKLTLREMNEKIL